MKERSAIPAPPLGEPAKGHTDGVAGGRFVAWAGFAFGSVVSVLANVLAARIPPGDAGPTWQPRIDTQIGAAVWPVALLLSVEVLARIRWPRGLFWWIARYGGVGTVALCSAVISYGHIHEVLATWRYPGVAATVGPLVIDGIMMAAGAALLADNHREAGGDPVAPPVASDDAELRARARWLFTNDPEIGRYNLCKALNLGRSGDPVSENQARKILDALKAEARPQLEAVPDGR